MTLTYKLDLDILPLDLHAKNLVCQSVRSSARLVTDTQTHRLTHDVKTIIPTSDMGCNKHQTWENTFPMVIKPIPRHVYNKII